MELLLLELFVFDGWLAGAELFQRLSEADELLFDQFCAAGGCCWAALLASAVLLSTNPANMSLWGDESALDRRGGALGYDTLAAVSDVTLCTEGLSGRTGQISARSGPR